MGFDMSGWAGFGFGRTDGEIPLEWRDFEYLGEEALSDWLEKRGFTNLYALEWYDENLGYEVWFIYAKSTWVDTVHGKNNMEQLVHIPSPDQVEVDQLVRCASLLGVDLMIGYHVVGMVS